MKYFKPLLFILLPILPAITHLPGNPQPCILPADSLRMVLPLSIDYDGHIVTPFVNITVNGKLFKTVFDTGSSGLRMMNGALPAAPGDTLSQRVSYSYGDAIQKLSLRGKVRKAEVAFDKLRTPLPISIMCIDSAKYNPGSDWIATGDSAVIRSNHFRNCSAIMGVGLRNRDRSAGVVSPLSQAPGNGKFIVMFPGYGGTKGSVIINPAPADEAGFIYFKLAPGKAVNTGYGNGWRDNELPGCITINNSSACLPTLLDSGNPDIKVFSNEFTGRQAVPSRNYVTLRIGATNDTAFIQTSFFTGDEKLEGRDRVYLDAGPNEPKMIFGVRFFFEFDVLYDQQNGIIGIRKKLHR